MPHVLVLILSLNIAWASTAPYSDQLELKAREWSAKGFSIKEKASRVIDGLPVAVAVYSAQDGSGDRLETYVVLKGKAYLGYAHPAHSDRLELDSSPEGRAFGDLFKDGSHLISYHSTIRALNAGALHVLRYKRFKFERVAEFPEGSFASDKGAVLVVSRDLPLGRFLAVGCEDFGTISQTAFRTRLFSPSKSKGRFVEVTSGHPDFFYREIERKTAALQRLRADLQKNAGEYLGLAISTYYDYAARGEARKGWDRQSELFQIPTHAPASVHACFETMRTDLRSRLNIPSDWR